MNYGKLLLSVVLAAGITVLATSVACSQEKGKDAPASASAPAGKEASGIFGWRGDGTGIFAKAEPALPWDFEAKEKKGINWTTKIGASPYGGAIVAAEKVFALADPDKLVCLDAASGKKLWEQPNDIKQLPNPPANPPMFGGNAGNTTATPVSDGKNVYCIFSSGIVACYDMDGKRQWIQLIDAPGGGEGGRAASPTLVGDKLIVTMGVLRALDKKTGKELWKLEDVQEMYGSPVAAKIGDVDIIVCPSGQIVRASDGKFLVEKGPAGLSYASPVIAGNVVYFIDKAAYAFELPAKAEPGMELKKLWDGECTGETGGDVFTSPVVHDGLVYTANDNAMLFVLDAKTGKEVYKKQLDISNASGAPGMPPGHVYPSIAMAGKYVFVSNDQGQTLALTPGKEYKVAFRCTTAEGHGSNLFFSGKRVYARGGENVYCLGQ